MRRTKIICTIGPASEGEDKLRELMLAGMDEHVLIFLMEVMRSIKRNLRE